MAIKSKKVRLIVVVTLIALLGGVFCFRASSFYSAIKYKLRSRCEGCESVTSPVAEIDPKIKEFGLQIDKLGILVPVIRDVNGKDKEGYNRSLQEGVAHYKGTALPDKGENIFIFGHSSSDVIPGELGKIFAKINDLEKGDEIKVYFQDKEFLYSVSEKDIVKATDTSVLDKTGEEILTLMTCWPIGTKDKRLIIRATRK